MLSLALAAGVAMKVVSERLGTHRSRSRPTFTPSHQGLGRDATDHIAAALKTTSQTPPSASLPQGPTTTLTRGVRPMCIGERAATSYLSVYPAGQNRPATSNLNFAAGQTIPNMVIVRVGAGNKVTFYNAAGYYGPITPHVHPPRRDGRPWLTRSHGTASASNPPARAPSPHRQGQQTDRCPTPPQPRSALLLKRAGTSRRESLLCSQFGRSQ